MDRVAALIAEARGAGLTLTVDGDRLVVTGPKTAEPIAEPIVERLRAAKLAVMARLAPTTGRDAFPPGTHRDAIPSSSSYEQAHKREFLERRVKSVTGRNASSLLLNPVTLAEILGPDANNQHAVACVQFDVLAAVLAIEAGIMTGVIPPRRLVYGRPLADWLELDEIARLLRMFRSMW